MHPKLTAVERRAVLGEYLRRTRKRKDTLSDYRPTTRELQAAEVLEGTWFPEQRAFFTSSAPRRIAGCTRRAGKTIGVTIWLLAGLLRTPDSLNLYICQTAGMARIYIWRELKKLVAQYELPFRFNETNLYMQHKRGGGLLILKGTENQDEIDKLRGPKWAKVNLDEAQSFGSHIENLIMESIGPALRDTGGHMLLTGTAGKRREGLYYNAWMGNLKRRDGTPVYELHKWSLQDNPYLPKAAKDEQNIIDEEGYSGTDDPRFLREYRGEWVTGESERMFAFDEQRNTYDGALPPGHTFTAGFGCDFGWNDETAIVTAQWAKTHACLYVPEAWAETKQYTDDVAAKCVELRARYSSQVYVGDTGGYGKNVCVHLARDYGIHVLQAQKREKYDHIAFFNSALRRGEVKVARGSKIARQLARVEWNEQRTDAANHSRDDLCFALLYIWRYARSSGLGRTELQAQTPPSAAAMALREKTAALNKPKQEDKIPWHMKDPTVSTGGVSRSLEWFFRGRRF